MSNPDNLFTVPGLMVVDLLTGLLRTKFHNPKYLELKQLRGNNPNLHYHYLTLRKTGQVTAFLTCFPMYEKHFDHFLGHFKEFIQRIRGSYWEIYVKKTKTIYNVDRRFKFFVQKLHHEVFLPNHKENKKFFITEEVVERFLDGGNIMLPV
jgi:hypothetical protein